MSGQPHALTAPKLAELIGVTTATIHRWARDGRIPYCQVGSVRWFDLTEVNAATLRSATAATKETPEPQLDPRLFEIVGRQARRASRPSTGRKKAERSA